MSVRLEGPRQVGACRVAVLAEATVQPLRVGGTLSFAGWKRPLAVLIRDGGETRIIPLVPRAATRGRIEALCPGAIAAMEEEGG